MPRVLLPRPGARFTLLWLEGREGPLQRDLKGGYGWLWKRAVCTCKCDILLSLLGLFPRYACQFFQFLQR